MVLRRCSSPLTFLLSTLLVTGVLPYSVLLSYAQITLDGSLDGPAGPLTGPDYVIDAEVGQLRGRNLFHSFGEFNVQTGESATFTGPDMVNNVVGRVTGGNPSMIDGALRSEITDANLYLLNPGGVIFGENATLEVDGSFHVSTGDYIGFADGEKFYADPTKNSILSVAPPEAFGFLGENPAGISIEGSSLQAPEGETVSVVGGDIEIAGGVLSAPSGQINIASVASAGEVIPNASDQAQALDVNTFERLGNIEISQSALIDTSGRGGGTVLIRGGRLVADNSLIAAVTLEDIDGGGVDVEAGTLSLTNGTVITTNTAGPGRGGNLTLTASEFITLSGHSSAGNPSALFSNTFGSGDAGQLSIATSTLTVDSGRIQAGASSESSGDAGDIKVEVERLTLTDGAQIDASTFGGTGQGGSVLIRATDSIALSGQDSAGFRSGFFSNTFGSGDAGQVFVSTQTLAADGGRIQAVASSESSGNAGDITVEVGNLTLTGGTQIDSSSFGGIGQGGNLTVMATGAIAISGRDNDGFRSGLFSNTNGSGDAGNISISAPTLEIDGGWILTDTSPASSGNAGDIELNIGSLTLENGAHISSSTSGTGRGGNLTVAATDSISIAGRGTDFLNGLFSSSGLFSITSGSGDAGNLFVSTPTLKLADGRIVALTTGDGNAGTVDVRVERLDLTDGAQISSSSGVEDFAGNRFVGKGAGGRLTVTATDSIAISGRSSDGFRSGLFSSTDGSGAAGDLFVSTPLLVIDGGRIVARTLGDGDTGDIEVQVGELALIDGAQIFNGTGTIRNGFVIGTGGPGRGGDIVIRADDSIFIAGRDEFPSGIFSNAQFGSGAGGSIFVAAPMLTMQGGLIAVSAFRESTGNAGDIEVQVGNLMLTEGAQIDSSTFGSGQGGRVSITTAGRLELSSSGTISARSGGRGNAGNIQIKVGETFRSRNGAVTTETTQAGGGAIEVRAGSRVHLVESDITTSVREGGGDAGNITVDPQFVILDDSRVIANAFEGRGGNIQITAGVFLASTDSVVDASSQLGIDGTVDVRAPVTEISGTFVPLPETFLDAAELLRERCGERVERGKSGRFVMEGRDGIPMEPGSFLPSPFPLNAQPNLPTGFRGTAWSPPVALSASVAKTDCAGHGFLQVR